ncbi:MAG: hypothetical protein HMLKMBBP_03587 [Planctomycetes bacterium]|nr:hypothetical protein [Planctomycetota bacterium]
MLGFPDLPGADLPCPRCGSKSGDCDWLAATGRCGPGCATCRGTNAARCAYCLEIVPCSQEARRNPLRDAACAWTTLAALHAAHCPWAATRGGIAVPIALVVKPI